MGDILFLAHRVPFPPNRGDKIRSANLLRKLATIGPVHVGCFAENEEDRAGAAELAELAASHSVVDRTKPLVLAGVEAVLAGKPVSLTAFHSPRLEDWVRETIAARDISTIFIFSGQMGQYVPASFGGRVIIDLCDVDSAKFGNYAANGQRVWINRREERLLACEEERLAHRADATVLISAEEAQLFLSRLQEPSKAHVQVIGNGIDSRFFDPAVITPNAEITARPGPHFVFTGQMDYPPNEAAALWTVDHFLPEIRARYPDAEFHVVGRNPTRRLLAREGTPGLTVWGEVPDVRPFLAAASCVVAPLQIARGIQNKVLEAMAMARPVMATPQAATGIYAKDGLHWLVSESEPSRMVGRLEVLLTDPEAAEKMGKEARQFVVDHYTWEAMLAPLEALVCSEEQEARDAA